MELSRLSGIIGEARSLAGESAGILPKEETIHNAPNAAGRCGEEPAGLHASGHVGMDQLNKTIPRPAIHHPPAFPGILASIDALLLYDGVYGIWLCGVSGNRNHIAAGKSFGPLGPGFASVIRADHAQARTSDVHHAPGGQRRRDRGNPAVFLRRYGELLPTLPSV